LKINRGLLFLLLSLLLLTPACDSSSRTNLPVFSKSLPPTPTPSPLPTATFTATSSPTPSPSFTATPSPTPTRIPTATLPPAPRPAVTAAEIARGSTERPWIALTLDAGGPSAFAPSILDTLRQKGVHCTFFLTGYWVRNNPELVQRMVAEGHELANHSNTHRPFTELTDEEIGEELGAVEEVVMELTGRSTKPYFRPPYGNRDDRVRRVVQENGYLTIYWTYFVWDWIDDEPAESVLEYAVEGACNGAIVVLHLGSWQIEQVLPQIIEELQALGYRLVTLSELLSP